jgi:hypothetical protein
MRGHKKRLMVDNFGNEDPSLWMDVKRGVAQGSILSPLCFNFFIDVLFDELDLLSEELHGSLPEEPPWLGEAFVVFVRLSVTVFVGVGFVVCLGLGVAVIAAFHVCVGVNFGDPIEFALTISVIVAVGVCFCV